AGARHAEDREQRQLQYRGMRAVGGIHQIDVVRGGGDRYFPQFWESGQCHRDWPRRVFGGLCAGFGDRGVLCPRHPVWPSRLARRDLPKLEKQFIRGRLGPQESFRYRANERFQVGSCPLLRIVRDLDESLRLQVRSDERIDRGGYPFKECTVSAAESLLSGVRIGFLTVEDLRENQGKAIGPIRLRPLDRPP